MVRAAGVIAGLWASAVHGAKWAVNAPIEILHEEPKSATGDPGSR